jgi:hypothetical protein
MQCEGKPPDMIPLEQRMALGGGQVSNLRR